MTGTYRTLYANKPYNDLKNYLQGKKKLDKFSCVNKSMNFDYLEDKIGYPTPYDMLTVIINDDNAIVQLSTYDESEENGTKDTLFETIDHVDFKDWITIVTTENTIIEIISTKELERQFKGIIKFDD